MESEYGYFVNLDTLSHCYLVIFILNSRHRFYLTVRYSFVPYFFGKQKFLIRSKLNFKTQVLCESKKFFAFITPFL